jgi:hypothetical protein
LLFDDPEVGAALAVPVQTVLVVPFVLECWRVVAVALDDVANLGEAIREKHFVHRLVAARTSPKLVLDQVVTYVSSDEIGDGVHWCLEC